MNTEKIKRAVIHNILSGAIWTPESGLYRNTFTALMKLSKIDLINLQLIVADKLKNEALKHTKETDHV